MAAAFAGITQITGDAANSARATAAATRIEQVHQAAIDYTQANQAALLTETTGGRVVTVYAGRATATAAVPGSSVASLPSLQGGGFLPSSYIDRNSFGQGHAVLLRQPAAGRLEFLVTQTGGRTIRDSDLGRIATKLGAAGGAILASPTPGVAANTIVGTGGGWREAASGWNGGLAAPTAGRAMSYSGLSGTAGGGALADYLYRNAIPGVPEANTMHTAIDMGGTTGSNDINRARNVDVRGILTNAAPGNTPVVADHLQVNTDFAACNTAHGPIGCSLRVGSTAPGQTYGVISSAQNGWVHFTAAGNAVAGVNNIMTPTATGGLAIIGSDGGGLGGNFVVGGRTELRGRLDVTNGWVSVHGDRGLFFEERGSGLHMPDANWIQTYGTAGILTTSANGIYAYGGPLQTTQYVRAPYLVDSDRADRFVDPSGDTRITSLFTHGNIVTDGWINATGAIHSGQNLTAVTSGNFGTDVIANRDIYAARDLGVNGNVGVNGSIGAAGNIHSYGAISATAHLQTGQYAHVGWGCANGSIAINAANGGMLFCQSGTYREPGASMLGRLYGGGGDWGSFSCEPNYHIVWFHMTVGNSNNAFFSQCVRDGY